MNSVVAKVAAYDEDFPPLSSSSSLSQKDSVSSSSPPSSQKDLEPSQKIRKTKLNIVRPNNNIIISNNNTNNTNNNNNNVINNNINTNNNNSNIINNTNNNDSETYILNGLHYSTKTNLPLWPQPAPKLPKLQQTEEESSAIGPEIKEDGTENPAGEPKKKKKRKRTRKRNKDPVKVLDDGTFSLNVGKLVVSQIKDAKRKMRIKEMQSLMNARVAKAPKKNMVKARRPANSVVSYIDDDESIGVASSLVLIGKNKDAAMRANKELSILVNNRKRNRTKKLTKLKKSIFRYRLKSLIESGSTTVDSKKKKTKNTLTDSDAALILGKISGKKALLVTGSATGKTETEKDEKKEKDEGKENETTEEETTDPTCKWAMCGETFPNTKEGLAKFKAHLEEHARADQEDMMCLWEGCQHPMFVKLRTLRLHAQRHAKLNRPKPPPVWTKDLVSDLKKAPHKEPADMCAIFPELPSGPELDECVAALLPPLGLLQSRVKAKKALTPAETAAALRRQRYVIGLREATREVRGGGAKLVVLANKIENIDVPGGPLAQVRKIVQYAREKGIPVVVSHSRKKLSALLKKQIKEKEEDAKEKQHAKKKREFNFGVSVVAVTSVEGADKQFKRIIEVLKEMKGKNEIKEEIKE